MEIAYLETTFFSFFHDERTAPAIVAMRDWTQQFWEERRNNYDLVTSEAVFGELRKNCQSARFFITGVPTASFA